MRLAAQIPYLTSLRKRTLGIDEIESLIDLFQEAVVLVDNELNKVVMANAKATELSAYTRSELASQKLWELITPETENPIDQIDLSSPASFNANLNIRNGKKIPIYVKTNRLDYRNNWSIFFLTPNTDKYQALAKNSPSQKKWESINLLIQAAQYDDSSEAIDQVLNIGRAILSAETLAVYFGDENHPNRYVCSHSQGQSTYLPETLNSSDFNSAIPDLWIGGNEVTQTVHADAQNLNLKYLASVPLSEPNIRNGYLLACDHISAPSAEFMGMLALIGTALAALYDQDSQNFKQIISEYEFTETVVAEDPMQFDYIFENLRDGVIITNPNLIVTSINNSAEKILGFSTEESISQQFDSLAQCTPSIIPALKAAQHGFPSKNLNNIHVRNRKGKSELANIKVLPISNSGEVTNIVILVNDLSAQEEFKIRTEQLENQAFLGEISAIFAHEVRNPINNISTGLQLMSLDLMENSEASDQIGRIQSDLDRLTDLTKSVLSFSGKREYRIRPMNVSAILTNILEKYISKGAHKNIEFSHTFPEEIPTILGDQRALEQVFVNLISNGINAMQSEPGEINVKIKTPKEANPNSMVEILISDSGPGIPEDVVKHIFEPFYTTKKEGTGLGLAISKRIIEAHKGKIAIESFPGGTIFSIKLPISNN
ncbi:MAG: ATP-binding protein [Chloroflexota bacterium]